MILGFSDFGNCRKEAGYYNYAGPAKYSDRAFFAPTYFWQTFTLTLVQSEGWGSRLPPTRYLSILVHTWFEIVPPGLQRK